MKQVGRYVLLVLFVLALSTRAYSSWRLGFDHDPVQHPQTIMAGESKAPHQYRMLFPLLWKGLSTVMAPDLADKVLLFATIVGCYTVLILVYRALMQNLVLACLGALAFLGTTMHPYQFQFRDTFLEVGLVTVAFFLQTRTGKNPRIWNWLALLSILGTLNRETWVFVVSGCCLAQCSRGLRPLWATAEGRTAVWGGTKMVAATLLTMGATRLVWGIRPLYCRLWTYQENLHQILVWENPAVTIGHGIWGVGAGVFLIYLLTLLAGNRNQRLFILGYLGPLLVVSFFLVARWIESRTFFPAFAVVIGVIGMYLRQIMSPPPAVQGES